MPWYSIGIPSHPSIDSLTYASFTATLFFASFTLCLITLISTFRVLCSLSRYCVHLVNLIVTVNAFVLWGKDFSPSLILNAEEMEYSHKAPPWPMHLVSSTLPFLAGLPTSFQFADSFHLPIIISIYLSTLQSYLLLSCDFSSVTFIYKKDPKKMQPPPLSPTSYPSIRNTQFLSRHFPSHSSLPLAILALHDPRFSLSLLPSLSSLLSFSPVTT